MLLLKITRYLSDWDNENVPTFFAGNPSFMPNTAESQLQFFLRISVPQSKATERKTTFPSNKLLEEDFVANDHTWIHNKDNKEHINILHPKDIVVAFGLKYCIFLPLSTTRINQ